MQSITEESFVRIASTSYAIITGSQPREELSLETNLAEIDDLDSLDRLELVEAISHEFGVPVTDEQLGDVKSLTDLLMAIRRNADG